MRMAFLGVQGVGKSTLIQKLISDSLVINVPESPSVGRQMKAEGFVINENAGDLDQSIALNYHLVNFLKDNMMYARTFMDALVYARYAYNKGKIQEATLRLTEKITKEMMPRYDFLFYIKPEFDIVPDGDRSTNVEFRDECAKIMDDYIKEFDLPVIQLSGTVEERIKTWKEVMKLYTPNRNPTMLKKLYENWLCGDDRNEKTNN